MYTKIMVPIDLTHLDKMGKALQAAADLAKLYGAEVHYVSVTGSLPSELARNSDAFAKKLDEFVAMQNSRSGVKGQAHPITASDPVVDLDRLLSDAGEAIEADLIIMASHVPGFWENLFHAHGNYVASHAHMSVFLVR
ncbi:universal stress protein [Spartinivicinus poritis]|uniref:Universal stress protein n=1 Tax=Spartinivicinus poritis TaxID=2994640 RepID=A0ABT5U6I1_9GAMM|nr:universal stress protein [Spartinivicinus sp. A2-2]MDE1461960.1 universal stress protein [Spartinivicinus sp. A2-2]